MKATVGTNFVNGVRAIAKTVRCTDTGLSINTEPIGVQCDTAYLT
jgi:hypothetical protein